MSKPRTNRGKSDPVERYTKWHWGEQPTKQIKVNDPNLPEFLIECGKLIELHVDLLPDDDPVTIAPEEGASLCFDPDHPSERLYIVQLPKRVKSAIKRRWCGANAEWWDLKVIAAMAGGRHATGDYPAIDAVPIGTLTAVVYATHKRGDGPSQYIHELGEETGIKPIVAACGAGNLLICGGNYTSPNAGITD